MRIKDINLSKKAEFCNHPSDIPCEPGTCRFCVGHGKCKLVEKEYEDEANKITHVSVIRRDDLN